MTTTSSEFNEQLAELAVKLSGMVAERLAYATKDLSPNERAKILNTLEESLPVIIANSITKSPSLHTPSGVKYFEEKAYLSQTGQLYLEAALPAHGNVFDFGPVFRADFGRDLT